MGSNRLHWVYLASFTGFILVSGAAFGQPVGLVQSSSDRQNSANVTTNRSDGAIFPAVIETRRVQKPRRLRVSTSMQALSNRKMPSPQEELAQGGLFVAPATGIGYAPDQSALSQAVIAYVTTDVKAKPRPKR